KTASGITVNVVSTDGSKANILGIDAGNYQLATVQSDVMAYAWAGTRSFETEGALDSFRVVGGLYAEAVQLVTMNDEIKTVADLKGKKVSIGAAGSGVYFNAVDVLGAAGLTEADIVPQYQSFADSADALKDGKIDAAFIVAGAPTPAIQELFTTNANARLVPIDGDIAAKLMQDSPYYTSYEIPASAYNTAEAITTVTVKATLIVSTSASEEDVYELTKAIFDNSDAITAAHAKGAELSLENATSGMTAPFHKGAAKYFAEKNITVESK
ncbi:MAG: TAXI family TRAP transporter solute-binding subunit, partial [Clostridia bacterium]|nr:TAXI family TRAP transporter solute-binding subunit [Clostridia bacterium]